MASITSDSCPSALHMITTALGSSWTISRVASMPLLYGMTMSMVTRSGLSSRNRFTAWTPSSALAGNGEPRRGKDVPQGVPHEERVVHDQDAPSVGCLLRRWSLAPLVVFLYRGAGISTSVSIARWSNSGSTSFSGPSGRAISAIAAPCRSVKVFFCLVLL